MKVKIEITYDDYHHEDSISEELKRSQAEFRISAAKLKAIFRQHKAERLKKEKVQGK